MSELLSSSEILLGHKHSSYGFVSYLFVQVLEPSDRKVLTNVTRWFTTCINQPEFLKVLGKISLCEKMVPVTAKVNPAESVTSAADSAAPATNGQTLVHSPVFLSLGVNMHLDVPLKCLLGLLGPPKTEAQLKKEAKKKEKLEKFQQKKEMEAKKKMQPVTEVWMFHSQKCHIKFQSVTNINYITVVLLYFVFLTLFFSF